MSVSFWKKRFCFFKTLLFLKLFIFLIFSKSYLILNIYLFIKIKLLRFPHTRTHSSGSIAVTVILC